MIYDGYIYGLTVRLRSIEESDADVSFRMRSDPEKSRYLHQIEGGTESQLEFIRCQRSKEGDYLFMIEDLQGKPIGMKGIYNFNHNKNEIESGRFLSYGSQVQNIEAMKLGFDFAFDYLGADRVIMSALENNPSMLGIQKRFGAVFTHRHYEEELGCDSIYSVLTKESYSLSKTKAEQLIARFAGRK